MGIRAICNKSKPGIPGGVIQQDSCTSMVRWATNMPTRAMCRLTWGSQMVTRALSSSRPLRVMKSWGLAGVPSVPLEGKAQHGDLLARDGVEHDVNHAPYKALLLGTVDVHN